MLSVYDYLVIGFYFAFMALIGWVFRRFITNTSDYFRGGGQMVWWMAGSSAFMVAFSAWTFTGAASKAYQDGAIIMVIFFANALGFLWNFLYFAPRFRQMRVITAIQGIRARFGPGNEQFFTWLQVPLGVLYAGIWLNGLGVFISAVFGFDLKLTIVIVGAVVVLMAVVGGSWAVVASDFLQVLILMPVAVVAAVLALGHIGGWGNFVEQVPSRFFNWTEVERPGIVYLWIIAILIKQFASTNNMLDGSRYLTVKDSSHARKAALLGMTLFLIGPIIWFIPPMVASVTHPDLGAQFPQLSNPSEAAFVAICLTTMPAGMIGLLVSGIFAATMSSMDSGLNRNAGFFVKNFYQVAIRPAARETELLLMGKVTTLFFGLLVVLAALTFSAWKDIGLFDLMLQFGTLVALPYTIPLIWGILIKDAPSWSGWSTVLVGFATSLFGKYVLTAEWIERVMGWTSDPLLPREQSDWILVVGIFLNVIVCSAWFLGTRFFRNARSALEKERVAEFFKRVETPIDFQREMGKGTDAQQSRTLGLLCLSYGAFIALLTLIPNPPSGRLSILFCSACLLVVGGLLRAGSRRTEEEPSSHTTQKIQTEATGASERIQIHGNTKQ